jgi:hypothetical protein
MIQVKYNNENKCIRTLIILKLSFIRRGKCRLKYKRGENEIQTSFKKKECKIF